MIPSLVMHKRNVCPGPHVCVCVTVLDFGDKQASSLEVCRCNAAGTHIYSDKTHRILAAHEVASIRMYGIFLYFSITEIFIDRPFQSRVHGRSIEQGVRLVAFLLIFPLVLTHP